MLIFVIYTMQDYVVLHGMFFKPFKNEIREMVVLKDPIGTEFKCILKIASGIGILEDGVTNIKNHYNLVHGAWLKLFYADNDTFSMRIEDRNLKEINYPTPAIGYEAETKSDSETADHADLKTNSANEEESYKETIVLTEKQTTYNCMVCQHLSFL